MERTNDEQRGPMIEMIGVEKGYGELPVLAGIDLAVERGEVFALLGPNGAGKTTTINILTTLITPDSGIARVNGCDVVADPDGVRRAISVTGQYAAVDGFLTGFENLAMIGRLSRLGPRARRRAGELLEQFDLVEAGDRRVSTYSGGMRRRLDLAISLVAQPPVIFLDEPTTGLDPRSRQTLWQVVRELAADGVTILLTTQYLEEADQLADRIAVIAGGRIAALGTAIELKQRVAGERVDLTFAATDDFDAAVRIVAGEHVVVDAEQLSISVPTVQPLATVRELIDLMDRNQITLASIATTKPSLDEVFMALTEPTGSAGSIDATTAGVAA